MIQGASIPVPLLYLAAIGFVLFSLLYGIVSAAIIYHLRAFSIPGHNAPRVAILVFSALSAALWLCALFFLLNLPR